MANQFDDFHVEVPQTKIEDSPVLIVYFRRDLYLTASERNSTELKLPFEFYSRTGQFHLTR